MRNRENRENRKIKKELLASTEEANKELIVALNNICYGADISIGYSTGIDGNMQFYIGCEENDNTYYGVKIFAKNGKITGSYLRDPEWKPEKEE